MPTDPKPAPTTFADLCLLPGWEPSYVTPDGKRTGDATSEDGANDMIGATYRVGTFFIFAVYEPDGDREGWCNLHHGLAIQFEDSEESHAVEWLLGMRALIEYAGAVAIAAAAPPTTIAELAARPGWRLDDGDAIHDQTDTIASPISVHLSGDQFWPGDERACAEAAYAAAAASESSLARALVAATANQGQE
jgi:hypothetical protein